MSHCAIYRPVLQARLGERKGRQWSACIPWPVEVRFGDFLISCHKGFKCAHQAVTLQAAACELA